MAGKIFNIQNNGDLVEMNESGFVKEVTFQQLLERYPDLLAGDQIQSDSPRRWLFVKREMGVTDQLDGSDRWSLDHLFIDQDGIPTLVEVKRGTDTRLRREVVGQVLDYAANAVVYWSLEQIQAEYKQQCDRDSVDPDARLDAFLNDDEDDEDEGSDAQAAEFWNSVKTNLQAGKVRLLFVADSIPNELRRIIEFLNSQMDPAEVLGIEIRQYVGQEIKTLVPRVIGQTAEAEKRKQGKKPPRDTTRFTVTVDGKAYPNQWKRRAILRVVQTLVRDGVSPDKLNSVIDWRSVLFAIPKSSGNESIAEVLSREYNKTKNTWFSKDDELIQYDDKMYAVGKQWGSRTQEALDKFMAEFQPTNISYKIDN